MNSTTDLTRLSASTAAAAIRSGALSSEVLVGAYLDRVAGRDGAVHAWAYIDADAALAAARACDAVPAAGPLHGVPVALKDVIDTADQPTEFGSEAFVGHRPDRDAACVTALRAAGAIILGKTVTAEFATYRPGPTANPFDPARTPGGSSSGSAAAVADRQVPLALGTQTAGSVIRPASFCGIYGFKPSFGRYPDAGVIDTAHRLDTLGTFARSIDDLALLDSVLALPSAADGAASKHVRIGLYRTETWASASAAMQDAFEAMAERLVAAGFAVVDCHAVEPFASLGEAQALIHKHEAWLCMGGMRQARADKVSQAFKDFIDAGAAIDAETYARACALQDLCKAKEADLFGDVDILLTPGAPDIAPEGLGATGNPLFNRSWTALGTPCLGFPAGFSQGMPLGLQFVGRTGADRALLAQAPEILGRAGVALPAID